jgi:subtilisin-like proprotein convertase family protein
MRTLLLIALLATSIHASAERRLELVRHSLTGAHCRYREYVNGIPSDLFEVHPCATLTAFAQPMRVESPLRIIEGRIARRVIVEEKPLERFAFDYDVETGALIRTVPLFFHAKPARVFDPNPVVALNDPSLQDRNDSADAVPEAAYRDVELLDVVDSGPLAGPHVKLVDRQSPNVAPPDAASSLVFDRAADGFEDVNVYFHVDGSQRHLQALGYVGERAIAAYAIEADAHSLSGGDNSFFLPSAAEFGRGTLHFGEGGTDDAEDADLVVHEYGHALQEWISPGAFGGTFASESRALSEGFGDYWAYSAHVAQRLASGRDPFCFADWDARCWEDDASQQCGYRAGADCLRRLDSAHTMADYEHSGGSGVEHRNGAIWSSALREIHQQLGRDVTDTIVLESMFDAPPNPTFAVMARRMIEVDRLLYDSAHAQTICAAMQQRGVLEGCDAAYPRGEQTLFQSPDRALSIPENNSAGITSTLTISDTRVIERVFVRIDIAHPVRGDLRIDLVAPDGTSILLQQASFDRGPDVHATFGITAQPAESLDVLRGIRAEGVWKLIVRDTRALDSGTLLSWGLVLQLEGDAPLTERPPHDLTIPVVTHVYGVGATRFASDLRISNPHSVPESATVVFTRSGKDGRTDFSAMNVRLGAGETAVFDDVVDSLFHTVGSGSLQVLGFVLATSRTYADTVRGTFSQYVPPVRDTAELGDDRPLALLPLPGGFERYNIGLTEVAGFRGVVAVGGRRIEVLPFSHVQFAGDDRFAEVRVVEGQARVAAYVSQVTESGDAMFIPGQRLRETPVDRLAPVIHQEPWTSDLWIGNAREVLVKPDIVPQDGSSFGVLNIRTAPFELAGVRIRHDVSNQYVPFVEPSLMDEQLLFIETTAPYRTNVGIFTARNAAAEVTIYNAAGVEVQHAILHTVNGVAQMPVIAGLSGGRAVVRFTEGETGHAYASFIDTRTGDATYVPGR